MPFQDSQQNIEDSSNKNSLQTSGSFFIEVLKVVIIALVIILPVRYFLIQPFYVRGASMEPNFKEFEYLIIDELSYRLHEVHRGDVIVLQDPTDTSQFFIKRVIGLPGETVGVKGGVVHIFNNEKPDGFLLDESGYLAPSVTTSGSMEVTLDADHYFVLGDNRSASLDSRYIGPIPKDLVVGRVWIRAWPLKRMDHFSVLSYSLNAQ